MTRTTNDALERERARRMRRVWRSTEPRDEAIERARRRILQPAHKVRRQKSWVVAGVQGFVLGAAAMAAADWGVSEYRSAAEKHEDRPAAASPPAPASASPARRPPRREPPRAPEMEGESEPEPTARPRPKLGSPAPGGRQGAAEPPPAPVRSSDTPGWTRVARALEQQDVDAADQSLRELAASGDPHTRDAAALARAQLWVSHGRGVPSRAELRRLAEQGQSALIRRRAQQLLERTADRSRQ